jgi:hypothetical protein
MINRRGRSWGLGTSKAQVKSSRLRVARIAGEEDYPEARTMLAFRASSRFTVIPARVITPFERANEFAGLLKDFMRRTTGRMEDWSWPHHAAKAHGGVAC